MTAIAALQVEQITKGILKFAPETPAVGSPILKVEPLQLGQSGSLLNIRLQRRTAQLIRFNAFKRID